MYKEGDWIIDKTHGLLGVVLRVYQDGVTARFGGMTAIRKNENIELAPLDLQQEDIETMIDLALATNDEDWFSDLTERTGVESIG